MKTESKTTKSSLRQQPGSLGQWLKRHRIEMAFVVVVLTGLALGWHWLAATGLLWLVLALAACGLMALSMRGGGQASEQTPDPGSDTGGSETVSRTASTERRTSNLKERNDG